MAGIDTGGTFTDTILISDEGLSVIKVPSSPDDPVKAILNSVSKFGKAKEVLHGSTVATNAVLERKGAKVGLITTIGFADIIEIGRQTRDDIYALYPKRPQPLVRPEFRFEVTERITSEGKIEVDLEDNEIEFLVNKLKNTGVECLAICTLFSFLNPIHENKLFEKLKEHYMISVSSEILPEFREYERTSTTVMDAYVKPLMSEYITNLSKVLLEKGATDIVSVMKSSKGLGRVKSIAKYPVHTLLSGLAAGVNAAELTAKLLKEEAILSLDIGGTSTDVASIYHGKVAMVTTKKLAGLPVAVPSVDVETIGAGGGSLIQLKSGLLTVGPESAGANPGPVAYNLGGTVPTITDADLAFGVLPEELAGGELLMDRTLAIKVMRQLAKELELTDIKAIEGARRIFHENIVSALRSVSTERGYDPREFSLLAFGGAGPVHACELAQILGMKQVIIPPYPGTWSAVGLIGADYAYDKSRGIVSDFDNLDPVWVEKEFNTMEEELYSLADEDGLGQNRRSERTYSLRFKGQSYDLSVDFDQDPQVVTQRFLQHHTMRYGFAADDETIEVVALRLRVIVSHPDPVFPNVGHKPEPIAARSRSVMGTNDPIPVFERSDLGVNAVIKGPAIVDQLDTTTWIPKEWVAKNDNFGFLIIKPLNN